MTGLMVAVVGGVIVGIVRSTWGQEIADRINATGVVDRSLDGVVATDWVAVLTFAGAAVWSVAAVVSVVLQWKWIAGYRDGWDVEVDYERAAALAVLSSWAVAISALLLVPGVGTWRISAVLAFWILPGLAWVAVRRYEARHRRRADREAPVRVARNAVSEVALLMDGKFAAHLQARALEQHEREADQRRRELERELVAGDDRWRGDLAQLDKRL